MGLNYIENTRTANVRLWNAPESVKESNVIKQKSRGRPPSYRDKESIDNPPTPLMALRIKLKLKVEDWKNILEVSAATVTQCERGNTIPSVPLAKRMIEEARVRGVAVTLDELYQHVVMFEPEQEDTFPTEGE